MRAEKVHLKNAQILKKNLFVVLDHFLDISILDTSIGEEQWSGCEPLLFLERSDGAERSRIFGAEQKKELTPK